MNIGSVNIDVPLALAPMAGVCDMAFRRLCREYGAAYTVGEMVSVKGIYFGDRKSKNLLQLDSGEHPAAVQLFGAEPSVMAAAVREAMRHSPDIIDINMGCPAPKIVSSGGGCSLMRSPRLAGEIIAAVVNESPVPVTVKLRAGWDSEHINAVELARIAEGMGASAITVHGRTREQFYSGRVDLEIIEKVASAVSIPVIGNGDITDIKSAKAMLSTGCKMLMVGRGALGSPWIFKILRHYLLTGEELSAPPFFERMQALLRQGEDTVAIKGEYVGMRELRKHAAWYLKGIPGAAALRREAGELKTLPELFELTGRAERIFSEHSVENGDVNE